MNMKHKEEKKKIRDAAKDIEQQPQQIQPQPQAPRTESGYPDPYADLQNKVVN